MKASGIITLIGFLSIALSFPFGGVGICGPTNAFGGVLFIGGMLLFIGGLIGLVIATPITFFRHRRARHAEQIEATDH